jgi:hypothetical protein
MKIVSYFVYYRFFNLAIITPDEYDIIDRDLPPVARKNLVAVAKTLQNLFNLILFDAKKQTWMAPVNTWIKGKMDEVREYFEELIDVRGARRRAAARQVHGADAEDQAAHRHLAARDRRDAPPHRRASAEAGRRRHRPAAHHSRPTSASRRSPPSATTTARCSSCSPTASPRRWRPRSRAGTSLYVETKELVISALRVIPITDGDDINLVNILRAGKKHAKLKNNTALEAQIKKILDNLKSARGRGLPSPRTTTIRRSCARSRSRSPTAPPCASSRRRRSSASP